MGAAFGCVYAPLITDPFWCRRCHHLLYDSQFRRRDDTISYANAFMRLVRLGDRLEQREGWGEAGRVRVADERFKPRAVSATPGA